MLIMSLLAFLTPFTASDDASLKQKRIIISVIALLSLLGIGWWLASPLFINEVVNEPFPNNIAAASQPVSSGQFIDLSFIHRGEGNALVFQDEAQQILRFEDFKVTNGPDLQVLLVEDINAVEKDTVGKYINLGPLKGNVGDQNYLLPADIELSNYSGVVIYCEPFNVVFSIAAFNS